MGSCCSNLSKNSGVLDKNQIHQKPIAIYNENKKNQVEEGATKKPINTKTGCENASLSKGKIWEKEK